MLRDYPQKNSQHQPGQGNADDDRESEKLWSGTDLDIIWIPPPHFPDENPEAQEGNNRSKGQNPDQDLKLLTAN